MPASAQLAGERVEVVDDQGGVGLLRRTEVRLDAEVHSHAVGLEPAAAPSGEVRRLRHLREPEHR